jgi:L-alanine-DL-glutamate epimerase-like enolase superfamily enzyme
LAAGLHLAAATPNFLLCEYPSSFRTSPLANDLFTGLPKPQGGFLEAPGAPGLGLTMNEDVMRAHVIDPYEPVR